MEGGKFFSVCSAWPGTKCSLSFLATDLMPLSLSFKFIFRNNLSHTTGGTSRFSPKCQSAHNALKYRKENTRSHTDRPNEHKYNIQWTSSFKPYYKLFIYRLCVCVCVCAIVGQIFNEWQIYGPRNPDTHSLTARQGLILWQKCLGKVIAFATINRLYQSLDY